MAIRAVEIDVGRSAAVDIDRDRDLVVRHQRGDESAFDELYRRYHRRLVVFCQRRVGNHHIAEELAQEAFVRALRALPAFAGERRFYPWMTVIAHRLCIDHHRRSARVEPAAEIDAGTVEPDHGDLWAEVDRGHLDMAMEHLAPRHREILLLREHRGWSYQQIATHLDVPMTTVEALLHRARKALRREYLAAAGDDVGRRLSAATGLGAALTRARGWAFGGGPDRWGPMLGTAAAGITAVGLAVGPLPDVTDVAGDVLRRGTPSAAADAGPRATAPSTSTEAAASVAPVAPTGDPSTAVPTATPADVDLAMPASPALVLRLGPVSVHHGSAAADYADATNADEPISVPLGDVGNVGIDPVAMSRYLVSTVLPTPEVDTP